MRSNFNVTAPASELSLLTISELRDATGVADGSQDATLMRLGRRASAAIARHCCIVGDGVHPPTLLQETCEETFSSPRDCLLRLARRPVTDIVSITVGGNPLDPSSYELNKATGNVSAESGWGSGKLAVSYVAGFATAPDDLKEAASRLVAAFRSETGQEAGLKRVEIPDVITKDYWVAPKDDPLMAAGISDLLAPYVERWI